jgi:hypothetical protein
MIAAVHDSTMGAVENKGPNILNQVNGEEGHQVVVNAIRKLDPLNPQVGARLVALSTDGDASPPIHRR